MFTEFKKFLQVMKKTHIGDFNWLILSLMVIVIICIWTCCDLLKIIQLNNSKDPSNSVDTAGPWAFIIINSGILIVLLIVLIYTNLYTDNN